MAKLSEFLKKYIGNEITIVYKEGGSTRSLLDGSTIIVERENLSGILEDVFEENWILLSGCLYNLNKALSILVRD